MAPSAPGIGDAVSPVTRLSPGVAGQPEAQGGGCSHRSSSPSVWLEAAYFINLAFMALFVCYTRQVIDDKWLQ